MLSRRVSISAVVILFLGCARAPSQRTQAAGQPRTSASASSSVVDQSAADVTHVVCERNAVKVKNPVVAAQPDGVHLLVENPGGAWASIFTTSRGPKVVGRGSS